MANPALIQKQIKDNAEDLHNFVRDLNLWEQEMKRKDRQLSNEPIDEVLPPVRRPKLSEKPLKEKNNENQCKIKKIRSYDYKAWDTFDVEKACEEVDIDDKDDESEEDSDKAEQEERYLREMGLYEKELGNQHVKASRWDKAVESYTRAISAYSKDPVFFANRALCYLKMKQYHQVETDCTEALKLDPTYVKALMRRAAAREQLERLEDARADLTLVLQLEPQNTQAQRDLTRVKSAIVDNKTKKVKNMDNKVSSYPEREEAKQRSKEESYKSPIKSSKETTEKEVNDEVCSSEPKWIPGENIIEPIMIAPHLRSKKSLKRVEIYDVGFNNPKHVCPRKLTNHQSSPGTTQLQQNARIKVETLEEINQTSSAPDSVKIDLPSPPKSSVQFHLSWNSIKTDKTLCFQFLKQIPGTSLPDIFKESLESPMFSAIVEVLATEFVAVREPVMPYLRGLSGVRRFSTIVLFMSPNDKKNLATLFKFCENNEECSPNEINELKKLYEVF